MPRLRAEGGGRAAAAGKLWGLPNCLHVCAQLDNAREAGAEALIQILLLRVLWCMASNHSGAWKSEGVAAMGCTSVCTTPCLALPKCCGSTACHPCPAHTLQCCVCPCTGGALKPTTMHGVWCHSACQQWIPEVGREQGSRPGGAAGILIRAWLAAQVGMTTFNPSKAELASKNGTLLGDRPHKPTFNLAHAPCTVDFQTDHGSVCGAPGAGCLKNFLFLRL